MRKQILPQTIAFVFALTARSVLAIAATSPAQENSSMDFPIPIISSQNDDPMTNICISKDQDRYNHSTFLVIRRNSVIGNQFKKDIDQAQELANKATHYQDTSVPANFTDVWDKYLKLNPPDCSADEVHRSYYYRLLEPQRTPKSP